KMNFYLNAVDELVRQPGDQETIGLILCPNRNRTVTEWALRGVDTPMAVARYMTGVTLTEETPKAMQPALPTLPALANELTDLVEAGRDHLRPQRCRRSGRVGRLPTATVVLGHRLGKSGKGLLPESGKGASRIFPSSV